MGEAYQITCNFKDFEASSPDSSNTQTVSRANPLIYSMLPYHAFIQPVLLKNPLVKVLCLRTKGRKGWKMQRTPSYRQQSRWDDRKTYKSNSKIDCDVWHREAEVVREFRTWTATPNSHIRVGSCSQTSLHFVEYWSAVTGRHVFPDRGSLNAGSSCTSAPSSSSTFIQTLLCQKPHSIPTSTWLNFSHLFTYLY